MFSEMLNVKCKIACKCKYIKSSHVIEQYLSRFTFLMPHHCSFVIFVPFMVKVCCDVTALFMQVKWDEHPVYVLFNLNSSPFLSSCKHMFPLQLKA